MQVPISFNTAVKSLEKGLIDHRGVAIINLALEWGLSS